MWYILRGTIETWNNRKPPAEAGGFLLLLRAQSYYRTIEPPVKW
jgi:hypothetical protein